MMMTLEKEKKRRIESIDVLRGVVMIIMALDHVRYYFHYDSFFFSATDIEQTNPALFFTRFITHFCAPVFLFLSGTSAFLVSKKKTKVELFTWLLKRGFWLILVSFTLEELAWSFQIDIKSYSLAVLWSLGASMIILSVVQFLNKKTAISLAIIAIVCQHFMDGFRPESTNLISDIWRVFHVPGGFEIGSLHFSVAFPLLPWAAVMILGYHFGTFYTSYSDEKRRKYLLSIGGISLFLFFVLRLINTFGDQNPWSVQQNFVLTLLSFFNISKAPASLCFILFTLGNSLLFLGIIEPVQNRFTRFNIIFGRTPFLFYLLHIYFIHIGAVILGYFQGYNIGVLDGWVSFQKYLQGYGVNLFLVYFLWVILVLILYPICTKFYLYKKNNNNFLSHYF